MTAEFCGIKTDDLGPSKVINLYFPGLGESGEGLRAIVVIDNTARGPAVGGVRVSKDVTVDEVVRLAKTMTLKNSIAGLPHGGGKAAIVADHKDPQKEIYFRAFARAIRDLTEYIPGPDMGSDEECMAWVYDETGRATGLPEVLGGIPLDRLGTTGYGLSECAEVACPYAGLSLKGAKVALQGFGSVGKAAARFLSEKGAVIVAVSDTKGCIYLPEGIDIKELLKKKVETESVINYGKGKVVPGADIYKIPCDILIPAAGPDVITSENVSEVKAKMVLQGANIPVTPDAEAALYEKGIISVPDFVANAGGVITAATEYAGKAEKDAFEAISVKIRANTQKVLDRSKKEGILPRQAALSIAKEQVVEAMRYRKQ